MRLDLAVHQVQDGVGLTCILNSIRLDLVITQVQGGVSGTYGKVNMLGLTINQV